VTISPFAEDVGETVPHEADEQVTVHVTPALLKSEPTVAVSWSVPLARTAALAGEMETEMAVMVTAAVPDREESAAEVAVMETFRSLAGVLAGAV